MTKIEIIQKVSQSVGITQVKSEEAVEKIFGVLKRTLSQGEPVILRRFGTFFVANKGERTGRNPKTGEEAKIAARRVVKFKSGKFFKDHVNSY